MKIFTGLVDEVQQATNGDFTLGNDRFKNEVSEMLERRVSPGKSGRPFKKME